MCVLQTTTAELVPPYGFRSAPGRPFEAPTPNTDPIISEQSSRSWSSVHRLIRGLTSIGWDGGDRVRPTAQTRTSSAHGGRRTSRLHQMKGAPIDSDRGSGQKDLNFIYSAGIRCMRLAVPFGKWRFGWGGWYGSSTERRTSMRMLHWHRPPPFALPVPVLSFI